jgi:hypothetical protein
VIFSAWICPFELAFLRHLPKNLYIVDNIVNTFFAVDIVLTFFVAYLDKETYLLVDNPKRIAARYVPSSQSNGNLAPNVQKLYPSLLKKSISLSKIHQHYCIFRQYFTFLKFVTTE